MPLSVLYLLKCSLSLSIVWLFYQTVLRRLTFYNWNRWYLLIYSALSFVIPLINIGPVLEKHSPREPVVLQFIPAVSQYVVTTTQRADRPDSPAATGFPYNSWNIGLLLVSTGMLFLLVRAILRWLSLGRMRRQATLIVGYGGQGGSDGQGNRASVRGNRRDRGIRIYQVDKPIIPFSFGNAIYINRQLHSAKEWEEIILHEYVHIRQGHTMDILLAELFCMVSWYNPFVWLIRFSIRQNLEFIADDKVLERGFDRKGYQYHLLKVVGEPAYRLANNFNFSSLKKRIVMMNRIKSTRYQLVKFLFVVPLIAVLLVAFRDKSFRDKPLLNKPLRDKSFRDKSEVLYNGHAKVYVNEVGIVADLITHSPIEGAFVQEKWSGLTAMTDDNGYFHMQIPVGRDSVKIILSFDKEGYKEYTVEYSLGAVGTSRGLITVPLLESKSGPKPSMYMEVPLMQEFPAEPSYRDAQDAFLGTVQQQDDIKTMMKRKMDHPEVALFYTTEDETGQIVILKTGEVERYGYPGEPGVGDMEKKYGPRSAMNTPVTATANSGYLSHWKKISAEAETLFHTTNPAVLRIIFPGDSRVLVVPVSGKPEIYDMDNADPKERPAFEKLYGKLPPCVPAPSGMIHTGPGIAGEAGAGDTIPGSRPPVPATPVPDASIPRTPLLNAPVSNARVLNAPVPDTKVPGVPLPVVPAPTPAYDWLNPLFVVDGVIITPTRGAGDLKPDDILSVTVLKDSGTRALYGKKGKIGSHGVILITTKQKAAKDSVEQAAKPASFRPQGPSR